MRFLVRFHIPVETGNELIRSGRMTEIMKSLMADMKPEAAYFLPENGSRTGYMFVQADDGSALVTLCEPFFMAMNAAVEFLPVMNADDLQRGLAAMEQTVSRFAFLRETAPVRK